MGKILDQARRVMALLNEGDRNRVIRITPMIASGPLPVTSSKFGGVPYLPEGVDVPTDAHGDPLGMIAQINCAELPDNDIYPKTGIVQFWLDPTDDLYGANYDNPIAQDNNRVMYYPEIGAHNSGVGLAQVDQQEGEFPVYWPISPLNMELALSFEAIEQGEAVLSEEFFDVFVHQWNSLYPDQTIKSLWDLDDLSDESVTDFFDDFAEFHKIGGKPIFVQGDPRDVRDNLKNYTANLLTMVSEVFRDPQAGSRSCPHLAEILWGDLGTANWLITPEQLAACDFSQVLFEWSCG